MLRLKRLRSRTAVMMLMLVMSQPSAWTMAAWHAASGASSMPTAARVAPLRRSASLSGSVLLDAGAKVTGPEEEGQRYGVRSRTEGSTSKHLKAECLITSGVLPEEQARATIAPLALGALKALKSRDMNALSKLVHPVKGVRFAPYAFVDSKADVRFTAAALRRALAEGRVRVWGSYDGSGAPIRMSFADYYKRFVYDRDFAGASKVIYNGEPAFHGNTHDNSREEYPDAIMVEYYMPGPALEREGSDFRSLRLVFEQYRGAWYLVHIIHDQWTI